MKEVFNIDLGLIDLSEEHTHIEERASKLHKKGLNHHEVSGGQPTSGNVISRHQEVDRQTSTKDKGLADVKFG